MAGEKKKTKDKELGKGRKQAEAASSLGPGTVLLFMRFAATVAVFCVGHLLSQNGAFASEQDGVASIWARLMFFLMAQAASTEFFALVMLQVARRLLGECRPLGAEMTPEEKRSNDPTIQWPAKELIPLELKAFSDRKGQPFFLNHVPAKRRMKDAFMRFGMMLASVLTVVCTSHWMDKRSVASLGLTFDEPFFRELGVGFNVGVFIVAVMFAIEISAGWIHFVQFFEVFDKTERFASCILWDVVFHMNVAVNEELPVRGWMLTNLAQSFGGLGLGLGPAAAFVFAMVVQSAFFVAMHLQSPGGSQLQSMINIFVGGIAGGLNVLFTEGRLGFAIGWHFGWNISMGNVFGLSTSGIPISGTFVSVAPHPDRARWHGGVFGPEGGVVAPVSYLLGVVLLGLIYGLPSGSGLGAIAV